MKPKYKIGDLIVASFREYRFIIGADKQKYRFYDLNYPEIIFEFSIEFVESNYDKVVHET